MKSKDEQQSWLDSFYANLQSLADTAFPKTCPQCGKVYPDSQAFLTQTEPVKDQSLAARSGLFSLEGTSSVAAIGVFRNCTCGTTIMADFQDRRDLTQAGNQRRARFDKVIELLHEQGMPPEEARLELRRLMRGQQSPKVEALLGETPLV